MKVLHVITTLELGGAQQNTLHTVAHLDRQRFSPVLIAGREGLLAEEVPGDIKTVILPTLVRRIRPLLDLRALAALYGIFRRHLREAGADGPLVVHTHSSKAGILGRAAARLAGVPIVVHSIHGFGFHDRQPMAARTFYILLEKLASRWTDHFIAVSRANIEEGVGRGIFSKDRVVLIRSGIEVDAFSGRGLDRKRKRSSLGARSGEKLVGMVACFKPQKNPLDFIRLAALVKKDMPDTRFVMAGDGELRPAVESAIADAGLGESVALLGWRRDVAEIIPALDVLVLTSLWEGLPRVLPQAMAAARPVVAYRVNGTPEAVADGTSGYLVEPGDYRTAAERVISLLRDPARAAAMGAAGRNKVPEFSVDAMVRQQEELYERLAGGRIT